MQITQDIEKWNYWLVFESNDEVVHLCGFKTIPNLDDIKLIYEELKSDEDFKLSKEVLNYIRHKIVNKEEGLKIIELF